MITESLGFVLDLSAPISAVSAVLCFVLALQAYHSFRFVKKDYLLNFSFGFMLLGLSFAIVIPFVLGFKLPSKFGDSDDIANYPVFAVMQTIAYVLIALAYSQTRKSKNSLMLLIGALVLVVVLVLLPNSFVPSSVDVLMYVANVGLLGFILYHMLKVMPPTHLVFTGFLLLAIHEYTAFIASINESFYNLPDEGSFFIADIVRLAALCILFYSFLATRPSARSIQLIGGEQLA